MEKTHLKFCCIYFINNASITQKTRFVYANGFILEEYATSLNIYLHSNVNKSIKTYYKKFASNPTIISRLKLGYIEFAMAGNY